MAGRIKQATQKKDAKIQSEQVYCPNCGIQNTLFFADYTNGGMEEQFGGKCKGCRRQLFLTKDLVENSGDILIGLV